MKIDGVEIPGEVVAPHQNGRETTVLGVLNAILRHRRIILFTALVPVLAVAVWVALSPREYTSSAAIMPTTRKMSGGLGALAAQFGVAVPADEPGQSPAFYADLLRSREVLGGAIESVYTLPSGGTNRQTTLIELYDKRGATAALRRERALEEIREQTTATAYTRTGTVQLTVTAEHPELAAAITSRLLDLAAAFNLETRQSQAGAERRFTEQRLSEVRADLRAAENALQAFYTRNQSFRRSSELSLLEDRLTREISRQQQLVNTLSEAFEQAKIEEVRNTPLFTIVERPHIPARPDSRRVVVKLLLALAVGLFIGACAAYARDAFAEQPPTAPERLEFEQRLLQLRADVVRPWRLFRAN